MRDQSGIRAIVSRFADDSSGEDDQPCTEARLRLTEAWFEALTRSINDVFYITDLERGELLYVSEVYEQVWGRPTAEIMADLSLFYQTIHPEDRQRVVDSQLIQARGEPTILEYRIVRPGGEIRYILDRSFPVPGAERRCSAGVATDITERKRAERAQAALLAELQHRVRNILATVRSIARRTGDGADDVDAYVQHLEGRINAMARTQSSLARSPEAGIDLENMVREELAAQAAREQQYRVCGPDVLLPPKAAEVLSLAVHELATNSVKYGALARSDGIISIAWTTAPRGGQRWLRLTWGERCTIAAEVQSSAGFGTELVTRRVPYELGGHGIMEVRPEGLHATIEFPLRDRDSILQSGSGTAQVL